MWSSRGSVETNAFILREGDYGQSTFLLFRWSCAILFRQQIAISTCNVCTQGGVVSSSIPEEIMSIHLMSSFFILRLTWPRRAQTVYQYHANRASTWCTYIQCNMTTSSSLADADLVASTSGPRQFRYISLEDSSSCILTCHQFDQRPNSRGVSANRRTYSRVWGSCCKVMTRKGKKAGRQALDELLSKCIGVT
jgi:hypothetical protein